MTDCNKARGMISDYIDGMLNDEDSSAFEEHISCCEKCHEEYDMIKAMSADLAKSTAKLPDGFSRRMHTALVNAQFESQENKPSKKVFAFYSRYARFATVAAAVMVFAVVGKYGVYDVYKNVVNETNTISEQYKEQSGTAAEPEKVSPEVPPETAAVDVNEDKNTADVSKKTVFTKKEAPVKTELQTKELVPENKNEQLQIAAYTPEEAQANYDAAAGDLDNVISTQDEVSAKSRISDTIQTDADEMSAEKLSEDSTNILQGDTYDALEEEVISSGSGGADAPSAKPEEEEAQKIPPEADDAVEPTQSTAAKDEELSFAPTVVEINKSGDGSMLVFKKYLYTFLDSSEIAENGDVITITVSADEFTSVIEKISLNEYVKSITMGTNVNGEAVITIK